MTKQQRSRVLEQVRGLMARGTQDPATEESRTAAVIALRMIAKYQLLAPSVNLAALTDRELVDLFEAVSTEAGRRQPASAKVCVHCKRVCAETEAYMLFTDGWMHVKCVLPHVRYQKDA